MNTCRLCGCDVIPANLQLHELHCGRKIRQNQTQGQTQHQGQGRPASFSAAASESKKEKKKKKPQNQVRAITECV